MCQHHTESESTKGSPTTPSSQSPDRWSWLQLSPPLSPKDDPHGFFLPAKVTSIERKYAVIPYIAEFWCTVTSWAFALPLLVLICPPPGGLHYTLSNGVESIPIEAPLIFSALTAVFSTLYHWTLWKIFSSLDAGVAIMTFYSATLVTMQAAGQHPLANFSWFFDLLSFTETMSVPGYASREIQFMTAGAIAMMFLNSWRSTAVPSVVLFALCLPVPLYNLWLIGHSGSALTIAIAVGFFLLDRLKIAATHPLWHMLGGYSLYLCFYNSLAHYNAVHVFGSDLPVA